MNDWIPYKNFILIIPCLEMFGIQLPNIEKYPLISKLIRIGNEHFREDLKFVGIPGIEFADPTRYGLSNYYVNYLQEVLPLDVMSGDNNAHPLAGTYASIIIPLVSGLYHIHKNVNMDMPNVTLGTSGLIDEYCQFMIDYYQEYINMYDRKKEELYKLMKSVDNTRQNINLEKLRFIVNHTNQCKKILTTNMIFFKATHLLALVKRNMTKLYFYRGEIEKKEELIKNSIFDIIESYTNFKKNVKHREVLLQIVDNVIMRMGEGVIELDTFTQNVITEIHKNTQQTGHGARDIYMWKIYNRLEKKDTILENVYKIMFEKHMIEYYNNIISEINTDNKRIESEVRSLPISPSNEEIINKVLGYFQKNPELAAATGRESINIPDEIRIRFCGSDPYGHHWEKGVELTDMIIQIANEEVSNFSSTRFVNEKFSTTNRNVYMYTTSEYLGMMTYGISIVNEIMPKNNKDESWWDMWNTISEVKNLYDEIVKYSLTDSIIPFEHDKNKRQLWLSEKYDPCICPNVGVTNKCREGYGETPYYVGSKYTIHISELPDIIDRQLSNFWVNGITAGNLDCCLAILRQKYEDNNFDIAKTCDDEFRSIVSNFACAMLGILPEHKHPNGPTIDYDKMKKYFETNNIVIDDEFKVMECGNNIESPYESNLRHHFVENLRMPVSCFGPDNRVALTEYDHKSIRNNITPEILNTNGMCVRLGHKYDSHHNHKFDRIPRWEGKPSAIDMAMIRMIAVNNGTKIAMPGEPNMPDDFFQRYFYDKDPTPEDNAYYKNIVNYFSCR